MKLSNEAEEYADLLFRRDKSKLDVEQETIFFDLQPKIGRVYGTEQKLMEYLVRYTHDLISFRFNSYLNAYRRFNEEFSQDDIKWLVSKLRVLVDKENELAKFIIDQHKNALYPYSSFIYNQFNRILPIAIQELRIALREMNLEDKPKEFHIDHSIHIQGDNYGEIQQGGASNVQNNNTLNGAGKIEDEKN